MTIQKVIHELRTRMHSKAPVKHGTSRIQKYGEASTGTGNAAMRREHQSRTGSARSRLVWYESRGDTIVEVLIAIAVVSSVLGIAYAAMNRNIAILRDNQERTEAAKIAQGQLESLRNAWNSDTNGQNNLLNGNNGCFKDGVLVDAGFTNGTPNPNLNDPNEQTSNYPDDCKDGLYWWGIRREGGVPQGKFKVFVRWDGLNGQRKEVIMVYKMR